MCRQNELLYIIFTGNKQTNPNNTVKLNSFKLINIEKMHQNKRRYEPQHGAGSYATYIRAVRVTTPTAPTVRVFKLGILVRNPQYESIQILLIYENSN